MVDVIRKDKKRISVVDVAVTGIVMMVFAILSVGAGYFINDNTPYEPQILVEQKPMDVVKPQQADVADDLVVSEKNTIMVTADNQATPKAEAQSENTAEKITSSNRELQTLMLMLIGVFWVYWVFWLFRSV